MMNRCVSFSDFGVDSLVVETGRRGGKIPHWMLMGNGYVGQSFWYDRKLHVCVESSTNTVSAMIDGKLLKLNRREVLAPKNTVPLYRKKTRDEILNEIRQNHPDADLHIPKVGCQLHGDIDAVLTINSEKHLIPWNY